MTHSIWLWCGFTLFILGMLSLDLGVFHRKSHLLSLRASLTWTCVWVMLALVFSAGVYYVAGPTTALEFITGCHAQVSPP
jgi:tellurite resistance protein TerC